MPTVQQSVALEKACVLFNAGALCTQIAAARDLSTAEVSPENGRRLQARGPFYSNRPPLTMFGQELDLARDEFEVAAGTFQYILDNFDNAPRCVAK